MADDLTSARPYPFDPPSEEEVAVADAAVDARPIGVPASYDEGESARWSAKAIADVQAMAQLGRYQLRGYNTFNRRMPSFDDLVFVPATMTRLPLEGYRENCDTRTVLGDRPDLVSDPIRLDIPIYVASMSFGALSASAKAALGYGASRAGSMTCTGEGGMLEEERAASAQLVYQMTPSRYMLDLEHLRMADGIEIVVGQGAKPGTGGILLGMKVSERVAEMRSLPVGVDQRSTVRHPDFLGADDLQVKIEELREATGYRVPIFVKMGATRPRYDVGIAAKAGCRCGRGRRGRGGNRSLARVASGPYRHSDPVRDTCRARGARRKRHVGGGFAGRGGRDPLGERMRRSAWRSARTR